MAYQATTATRKIASLQQRIRVIQGGTSASKTISILLYLIDKAQADTKPTLTSVVSESMPHIKKGALRDFRNIMQGHNYWKPDSWRESDKIYTFESGSQIEFFGADSADKLRGGRRDRLFVNEANNISFMAFEELEVRTRELIFIDYNPTNEFWYFTEIKPFRNDFTELILTYKDNEALDQATVDSIEQRKGRKDWWQVYGLGQLGELEGKIYKDWAIIDEIPHEARLECYGLDFGYTNDPTAIVAIYKYNQGYILDEIAFAKGMSNKQIADIIQSQNQATVIADSAEPKSIDELKMHGLVVLPSHKGKDSVNSGIQLVQRYRISVTKNSTNVIKEYRNY
jgi:phage terminase large subunit